MPQQGIRILVPDLPPIGVPVVLSPSVVNATTLTTTVDASAGSLVVVSIGAFDTASISLLPATVSDNAGNTYTFAVEDSFDWPVSLWYCSSVNHMPIGTVITFTGSQNVSMTAAAVANANGGLDQTNHTGTGSLINSLSLATGTLSQANEIVFGGLNYGSGLGTWTEGAGFTSLGTGPGGRPPSYDIVNSIAPVTWAPSWTTPTDYSAVIATFKNG